VTRKGEISPFGLLFEVPGYFFWKKVAQKMANFRATFWGWQMSFIFT
jgi:hypothetical protein